MEKFYRFVDYWNFKRTVILSLITSLVLLPLLIFAPSAYADDCKWYDVGCHITNAVTDGITKAIASIVESTMTFWMAVKFQNIAGKGVNAGDQVATDMSGLNIYLQYGKWIAAAAAAAALIVFFLGLARSRHEGNIMDRLGKLLWIVIGLLVASAAIGVSSSIFSVTSIQVNNILEWVMNMYYPLALGCAAISLIVTGIRLIAEQTGKPLKAFIEKIVLLLLIANVGPALLMLVGTLLDTFSDTLIQNSFNDAIVGLGVAGGATGATAVALGISSAVGGLSWGWQVALLLLLITSIISLTLCIVMVIRSIMLVMLSGFLVLYAAVYDTKLGQRGFESLWTWIIALLLFKPAAATVYAVGLKFLGSGGFDGVMYWMGSSVMAILTLPALVKIIAPTTAAISGGGSGASLLAGGGSALSALGGGSGGGPTGAAGAAGGGGSGSGGTSKAAMVAAAVATGGASVAATAPAAAGGTGAMASSAAGGSSGASGVNSAMNAASTTVGAAENLVGQAGGDDQSAASGANTMTSATQNQSRQNSVRQTQQSKPVKSGVQPATQYNDRRPKGAA